MGAPPIHQDICSHYLPILRNCQAKSAKVQYVSVHDLRTARSSHKAILVQPKGAEEGFEARINWPAAIAHAPGAVVKITPDRIWYKRQPDNRTISLSLLRKGLELTPLVNVGQGILEHQLIAAVVPVSRIFPCDKTVGDSYYIDSLSSPALSKRYASAKALSCIASSGATEGLVCTVSNADEHIYVRLEAAASLARQGHESGIAFVQACLADSYLQNRLEAVIVLGEIATDTANRLLVDVLLDAKQHPEIRAGSAWALGELRNKVAMNALIDSFDSVNSEIRIEAARALAKLASQFTPDIVQQLSQSSAKKRPGIAWALSKSGRFSLQDVLDALVDDDARQWVAYVLGMQDQQRFVHEIERLRAQDPEVYFAVTVLWKIVSSWVYRLEEY